jgi:hypothetical protein
MLPLQIARPVMLVKLGETVDDFHQRIAMCSHSMPATT